MSIQALGKADAVGIVAAIDKGFLDETDVQRNEWRNNTVGMSTDSASVMIGIRNDVVTMIKADVQRLISVHCVAHQLEFGIKESINQVAYLAKVEDFLLSIYKFYSNSPLNWHNCNCFEY